MKQISKIRKNRKGTVTIETAIFLPIFFFMFMAIFGIFVVILARHQVRHAFIQTAKSLSKDSFVMEQVDTTGPDGNTICNSFGELAIALIRWGIDDEFYTSRTKWYAESNTNVGNEIIRDRFVGFLAGGDEKAADNYLKTLRVKNGLNGVNFEYYVENGELTLKINYTVEYWFNAFGAEEIKMQQTVNTKMWAYDGGSGGPPSTT